MLWWKRSMIKKWFVASSYSIQRFPNAERPTLLGLQSSSQQPSAHLWRCRLFAVSFVDQLKDVHPIDRHLQRFGVSRGHPFWFCIFSTYPWRHDEENKTFIAMAPPNLRPKNFRSWSFYSKRYRSYTLPAIPTPSLDPGPLWYQNPTPRQATTWRMSFQWC